MKLALKFEQATRRIEMMLLEAQIIAMDADDIVRECEEAHEQSHGNVDVCERDAVLAERHSIDKVWHAKTLRSSAGQLRTTLESEVRRLRDKNPFALGLQRFEVSGANLHEKRRGGAPTTSLSGSLSNYCE